MASTSDGSVVPATRPENQANPGADGKAAGPSTFGSGPDGATNAEVVIEKRNAAGVVCLNRPKALNALSDAMRAEIAAAFVDFAADPIVYAAVIYTEGTRAFCAGGDVRELVAIARSDHRGVAEAHGSFGREYKMNWLLECFPKPTVSLIDGFVAGSGVGLTLFGTHRVAGPNYKFAMPETAIGLFPDVGVGHALARLPDQIGIYLGLSGVTIGRRDAFDLGLVTHCIEPDDFDAIVAGLSDAMPVDALLAKFHRPPDGEPGSVMARRERIAQCFAGDDLIAIIARLEACAARGDADAAWADETLARLTAASPLSLAVTLRHLRTAADLDIRETLINDYRLALSFLNAPDFAEGVRAMLIDKDRNPRWQPATIEALLALGPSIVDQYFERQHVNFLLPSRNEMQKIRKV